MRRVSKASGPELTFSSRWTDHACSCRLVSIWRLEDGIPSTREYALRPADVSEEVPATSSAAYWPVRNEDNVKSRAEVIERFNRLSLADSMLEVIEIRTGKAECRMKFESGGVLRSEGASIFDPKAFEAVYEPALLRFLDVRSMVCGGAYQLNSTVVDYGAEPSVNREYIEFYFDLTGGSDPEAFLVRLKFLAKDFELGRWP